MPTGLEVDAEWDMSQWEVGLTPQEQLAVTRQVILCGIQAVPFRL